MKNKLQPLQKTSSILLNKYLSNAGACSRRQAAEYIKAGKVKVNGVVIKEPWYSVSPSDSVELNDQFVVADKKIYILLNKPKDYVTTVSDPSGRRTVIDLIQAATTKRIYPVGRLDRATTGLLLLTNDGQLTQKLAHPKNEVKKVYVVLLDRPFKFQDLQTLHSGIHLKDGIVNVDRAAYVADKKNQIRVQLHSGKNRIVRRMFEHFGYQVIKLDRINYAGLTKRGLPVGKWRLLTSNEIQSLKNCGQVEQTDSGPRKKNGRKTGSKTRSCSRTRGCTKKRYSSKNN